jgi:hypothetical protein
MSQEDEIQKALTAISLKIELLENKRRSLKQWSIIFTLVVLGAVSSFIAVSFQKARTLDGDLFLKYFSSLPVRQVIENNLKETAGMIFPEVKKAVFETFIKDPAFIQSVNKELDTFLTVVESDLSLQVNSQFVLLADKQKLHLYEAFPELKDNPRVEKAMQHIIQIGGPRLRRAWINNFQKHIDSLRAIYSAVEGLKDPDLAKLPSFEKAVLGVTLELFGKILSREGEKGESSIGTVPSEGGK